MSFVSWQSPLALVKWDYTIGLADLTDLGDGERFSAPRCHSGGAWP
jgi:hypothetical protein